MKILYYDCFSGISGDMNLGALVDLGVPFEYIKNELDKLSLSKEYEIYCEKSLKKGISGTRVKVVDLNNHKYRNGHNHIKDDHNHEHTHTHNHHSHLHTHEDKHEHTHDSIHHHERNYGSISKLIMESSLSEEIKALSIKIFNEIAIAESMIHNKPMDQVHFHEVGAIDSIVDIIGAAIAIDYLKVDRIISSPVEVGYGMVKAAHGLMPVPAPATAQILNNIPIKAENASFEATTPTGAAILKATSSEFTYKKDFTILKVGYGIGEKENKFMANVLRVFLAEKEEHNHKDVIKEFILESNIDDMRAEEFELLTERLFHAGALDVFYTNILMKKQRPAIKLSLICNSKNKEQLKEIIFKNSSTIGIRENSLERTKLKRKIIKVTSSYGIVDVKISLYDNKIVRIKPEYDQCKEIAINNNISINEVYTDVLLNYQNQ